MPTLKLQTAPAELPLSLAETKAHLRVDDTSSDDLISRLIGAAVSHVDGAEGWLGRALISQTWELALDAFPTTEKREIVVPLPPLQSITSITYVDTNGATQTLSTDVYDLVGDGGKQPARIVEAHGETWPSTRSQREAVTVRFVAGYGDTASDVPEAIRHGLLLMIGHLYEHREDVIAGVSVAEVPMASQWLLMPFRVWGFG